MAITPSDIDGLPEYSAVQHLKMWNRASIELAAAGVTYSVPGRSLTRNDGDVVRKMIEFWEQRVSIQAASELGAGIVLVRFGQEQ